GRDVRGAAAPPRAVPELLDELGRLAGPLLAEGPVARPDADVADVHGVRHRYRARTARPAGEARPPGRPGRTRDTPRCGTPSRAPGHRGPARPAARSRDTAVRAPRSS